MKTFPRPPDGLLQAVETLSGDENTAQARQRLPNAGRYKSL